LPETRVQSYFPYLFGGCSLAFLLSFHHFSNVINFSQITLKMSTKKKQSLPRLLTNRAFLEQPPNALCNAPPKTLPIVPVMPDRPMRKSSLFKEDKSDDENIAPVTSDRKCNFVASKKVNDIQVTKVKKLYYEDAFTVHGSHNAPKDRVAHESVVVVELRTNTKVCTVLCSVSIALTCYQAKVDILNLLSNLSHSLAQIYQRPKTSLLVTIDENTNLLFGTTHGPAYLLKVSALSSLIAPLTNFRNTNLIQATINDLFGIPPENGVVIFNPVDEDNLATNGKTAREEIDRLECSDQSPSIFKSISRSMSRRMKRSSDNSAPLSLSTIMSPDVPTGSSRSPIVPIPADATPFQSHRPDDSKLADSTEARSSLEKPPMEDLPELTLSKDEQSKRSLKKRESLKSFVNRRLNELGEIAPFMSPKPPSKGKKD
jgi:hypothetical protein